MNKNLDSFSFQKHILYYNPDYPLEFFKDKKAYNRYSTKEVLTITGSKTLDQADQLIRSKKVSVKTEVNPTELILNSYQKVILNRNLPLTPEEAKALGESKKYKGCSPSQILSEIGKESAYYPYLETYSVYWSLPKNNPNKETLISLKNKFKNLLKTSEVYKKNLNLFSRVNFNYEVFLDLKKAEYQITYNNVPVHLNNFFNKLCL